jgi:hypothetical protein
MKVFSIEPLGPKEMREVVRRIAVSIWREAGRRGQHPEFPEAVIEHLSSMSLRDAKQAIVIGFGRAPPRSSAPRSISASTRAAGTRMTPRRAA